jgi:hypothetical protein
MLVVWPGLPGVPRIGRGGTHRTHPETWDLEGS